jgi:NAD(P)-dependent dehydrogenase (short-subunit alcohol dehydrogenase family)
MTRAAKVAIVTGAGSGIGRATALRLAQCGAHVAVVDRDEAAGSATAQQVAQAGGSAHFICADVADIFAARLASARQPARPIRSDHRLRRSGPGQRRPGCGPRARVDGTAGHQGRGASVAAQARSRGGAGAAPRLARLPPGAQKVPTHPAHCGAPGANRVCSFRA